jgi:hypothetical protein
LYGQFQASSDDRAAGSEGLGQVGSCANPALSLPIRIIAIGGGDVFLTGCSLCRVMARHRTRRADQGTMTVNGSIMSLSSCSTMWQW